MNKTLALIALALLITGCAARIKGGTYAGYSCQESLLYFDSYCAAKKMTKDEFQKAVTACNEQLTQPCDKEYADLLWCMGRVQPGQYSKRRGVLLSGMVLTSGTTYDGCSCDEYVNDFNFCKTKLEYLPPK